MLHHDFEPVYNKESKILILGTFPSVKSREQGFYYGHPKNRFWNIMAWVGETDLPTTIEEKKKLLLDNYIAVWDVIQSCDIIGSSDSSIRNVIPADLNQIFRFCNITTIYANGRTAEKLYNKYQKPIYSYDICGLPSTSPANAAYSMERLKESWGRLKKDLKS